MRLGETATMADPMNPQFQFDFLAPREVLRCKTQVVSVYRAAFSQPPYLRGEPYSISFGKSLRSHTKQVDFYFLAARDKAHGGVVGFGYGYTCTPGQWWFDYVARAMTPSLTDAWLVGSFELVELAVHPNFQGQGIGKIIHDRLLANLPHRRAVLSTMQTKTAAWHLYDKRGWIPLLENITFPGSPKPYMIMGIDLSARKPPGSTRDSVT